MCILSKRQNNSASPLRKRIVVALRLLFRDQRITVLLHTRENTVLHCSYLVCLFAFFFFVSVYEQEGKKR
jgi:hypothetical protein